MHIHDPQGVRLALSRRRDDILIEAAELHEQAESVAYCQATYDALMDQALALEQKAADMTEGS